MSIYRAVVAALAEADLGGDLEEGAKQILTLVGSQEAILELTAQSCSGDVARPPAAYLHSNGFLKVEYLRSEEGGLRLRGHFWNPAWGSSRQNPHNHAFGFHSRVVQGAFRHRRFSRADEGGGSLYFGYRYQREMRTGVDQYSLEQSQPAWLLQVREDIVLPGAEYALDGHELHTLDPAEQTPSATILVSKPRSDGSWSHVYSSSDKLHLSPRNAKQLSADSVLKYIADTISA